MPHAWIVDPARRVLESFKLEAGSGFARVETWREADRVRAEPFDAVELELDALWRTRK